MTPGMFLSPAELVEASSSLRQPHQEEAILKYLLALAVALLIASGFGMLIGSAGAGGAVGNMLTLGMFVAIYFACRRILTWR